MNVQRIVALIAAVCAGAACEGNQQSMNVSGTSGGNISQSQSGVGNSQSMSISGSADGKTPSVTQTQSGVNRQQSLTIDGKKVESSGN